MVNIFRKHKVISALVVIAVIGAATVYLVLNRLKDRGIYEPVVRGSIVEAIYGIGTVKASRVFQLKVAIPSVIEKILVEEGSAVKKGDDLIVLDASRRYTAPFSGVINELNFKEGETVLSGASILMLTDISDRYFIVSIEQQGALKAKPGQSVELSFESIREQNFHGRVKSVYSSGDRFLVRIEVQDLPATILPGMTADISISVKTHEDVLLVPVRAIDVGKVYVKDEKTGRSVEQKITTGIIDGNKAQVLAGEIREGDLVRVAKGN
jgi:multidrug efflux pump subunit AcrA (membrane-fusion protein)